MYFDIYKTKTGYPHRYWWVAKGSNHETLCSSEMLASKRTCVAAIKVVKAEASSANVYDETGETPGSASDRRLAA